MLIPQTLENSLHEIFDTESASFEGFPENKNEAAIRWANGFDIYAKSVIPVSISSETAKGAFISTFMTIDEQNGLVVFPLCFHNYAIQLAFGMSPLFTGVPPIAPPVLKPVFDLGFSGASSAQCIKLFVEIVDKWMRTGVAIQKTTNVPILWN